MKKNGILAILFLVVGFTLQAQDLSGNWTTSTGFVLKFEKLDSDKLQYRITNENAGYYHKGILTSYNNSSYYEGTLERINKISGCTTYIKMTFTPRGNDKLSYVGKGKDTNCDIPAGWSESFLYTRK